MNKIKIKLSNISLLVLLTAASLVISCGGGGGGGGGVGATASSGETPASVATPGFTISTLDSTGDVGMYSSIATGSVHIGYYDNTNYNLKYAYCADSNNCSTPIEIDSMGMVSYETTVISIAVRSGVIHISYYGTDNNGILKYATCNSNSSNCTNAANWSNVIVDNDANDVGSVNSIWIDYSNNVHISYYDFDAGNLKYATCSASSDCTQAANWNNVIIDNSDDAGQYTSITTDASNNIHISYYDGTNFLNGDLKYAVCSASSDCTQSANWTTVTIDSSGDVGLYPSISTDSNDSIHITYNDFDNGDLKYATCSSNCSQAGNWSISTIDSTGDVGDYASLAVVSIDSIAYLHISYYDFTNKYLKYATCSSDCAQAVNWTISTIDSTGDVGEYSSISINTSDSNSINISYYDSTNGNLKYAVK